jgi:hypothetical protein
MPVRAAVQYVKICNLYGDGFYYLPGTSICVKIGGYARGEYGYLGGANMTNEAFNGGTAVSAGGNGIFGNTGANGYNTRWDGADFVMRARAYISMDSRQQTEFGVLRTYVNIGLNYDSPTVNPFVFSGNRAFVQFAGFTFGLAQSFFDFYSVPASSYWGIIASDTGDGGWKVAGYTAAFGNGITSTLSMEEPRRIGIVNTNLNANDFALFGAACNSNVVSTPSSFTGASLGAAFPAGGCDTVKIRFPDMVWNMRIDQVWGSAQVMFAAHDASAAYYYSTSATAAGIGFPNVTNGGVNCPVSASGAPSAGVIFGGPAGTPIGSVICGHPADKLGWAAGAGFRINVPNTNGSYFQMQYTHTLGATRYMFQTQTGHYTELNGGTLGFGWLTDGIVNNFTGGVDLTKVDGINAAFDYHWTPKFWTSLYGTWARIRYDDIANVSMCSNQIVNSTGTGITPVWNGRLTPFNCSNNWSIWQLGSRWQYNLTPAMYVGVDVLYQKLNVADQGSIVTLNPGGTASTAAQQNVPYQVANQDNWGFRLRVHRDILP